MPSPVPPQSASAVTAAAVAEALRGALLESRQRWRDLAGLAADLVFETDAAGRLAVLAGVAVGLDDEPGGHVRHALGKEGEHGARVAARERRTR